ncbi:MAG: hypothetical protein ABII82_19240, partial [Verrucomicrobiota bacterium]
VMHAATFFRESGEDALLLSVDRLEEWRTYERAVWTDFRSADNLRFYSQDGHKYMTAALAGPCRFWVAGLVPRNQVVKRAAEKVPAGPEVWLSSQLGLWNLDTYKNRQAGWNEQAATNGTPSGKATALPFDQFKAKFIDKGAVASLRNFLPFFGGLNGRSFPAYFSTYALSRDGWTQAERDQARHLLVFIADYNDGDDYQPHRSMLSGHPNFLMDAKQNVALAAAVFPDHPRASAWRDSFLGFYAEFLDRYARKDRPELNTRGGRWTENIACYLGQCLDGILTSHRALKAYDGTSLGKNPDLLALLRWVRDAFMSPHDGARLIPPQGAHSRAFEPGRHFWEVLGELAVEIADDDPVLSQELRWIMTNGKEGKKPDVRSALFTDYGPVFHHDFGGARESYAHLQNIHGPSYRWSRAGIVYYGAKGKAWSYNNLETNGDDFDWKALTAFTVNDEGLAAGPTDQLLYDFEFVQFYRQPASGNAAYQARALMLVRDDYLALADEVRSPETAGVFRWASIHELPQIYQLKPGATWEESVTNDRKLPRADNVTGKARAYIGQGDFLTVVAPTPVETAARDFGAVVNGEYVFASQHAIDVTENTVRFVGTYGYARANQLALFQGTRIGLDGFELRREGGDFGVSATVTGKRIVGRAVGRKGGDVFITPPPNCDMTRARVLIDTEITPHAVVNDAIRFPITLRQQDGLKSYEVFFD